MRRVLFRSTILLILFTLANLYFAVLNWQIFIVKLNINLGFGVVEFPPFIALFALGFIIMGILSWSNYNIRLRKLIYNLEHGVEVGKLKDKLSSNRIRKLMFDENNLDLLKNKLGVSEILKKQEELNRLLAEMQKQSVKKQ